MKYINFNNAGSSRPYSEVNKEIRDFLKVEYFMGGYYAVEKYKKKLEKFYYNLSKLINCKVAEISFLSSTTQAWNLFFNSIQISKKENIVIFENEYGSNLIYYKKQKLNVRIVKINEDGKICLKDLLKKINKNTKIISLCHIASQCGDKIEAAKIFNFVRNLNPDIICVLDACQSIGQIKVDVKEINCDVLVGSGRKYLRGPRGTGFIYINEKIREKVKPMILDLKNTECYQEIIKIKKANIFENFEYSPALQIGLGKAIERINSSGINQIELQIRQKSQYLRKKLDYFSKITFFENFNTLTGINTLKIEGLSSLRIYNYLLSKRILTSISTSATSLLYFNKKKIKDVLRISIHHYNSLYQINYLIKCLIDLIKK